MEFGIGYFPTHDATGPGEVARLVEEHGFESLFFAEHTHIPASRETPYAGGGELPRKYLHTYDLFVALTAAAAATSRLRIGSGVCLVIEHDPIMTAKQVASVDHLSGGRFEFGVGAGWNREEMQNHGTDPRTRMRLLKERVEAMKAIWTEDEASYHGEFVNFTASGPGRNRRSARTRRSSSAAPARPCSSVCSRTGMPGSPTTRAPTRSRARPN
jgi:probable F420-dependent oxidoreductase